MNLANFRVTSAQRTSRSISSIEALGCALGAARLDPDLIFDTLSAFLNHLGASAAAAVAWMRHEDVRTLVHHPLDVAATMSWAGGFYLLSLCVRAVSRVFRQRRVSQPAEPARVD